MARQKKSSGSDRRPAYESNLSRRGGVREPRVRLLVVCGAAVTEPAYLKGLRDHLSNPAVTVKVAVKAAAPNQVVQYAVQLRDQDRDAFDEVWCVLDVDQFPDLPVARANAEKACIELAISNPCFELWLLLHKADHEVHCGSYSELERYLKRHIPHYDKVRIRFADYAAGLAEARDRAQRLDPSGLEYPKNPATNVW